MSAIMYGSPISISANSLQTNLDNLYNLLTEKLKEHKLQAMQNNRISTINIS